MPESQVTGLCANPRALRPVPRPPASVLCDLRPLGDIHLPIMSKRHSKPNQAKVGAIKHHAMFPPPHNNRRAPLAPQTFATRSRISRVSGAPRSSFNIAVQVEGAEDPLCPVASKPSRTTWTRATCCTHRTTTPQRGDLATIIKPSPPLAREPPLLEQRGEKIALRGRKAEQPRHASAQWRPPLLGSKLSTRQAINNSGSSCWALRCRKQWLRLARLGPS